MTVPQLDNRFLSALRGAFAAQLPTYLPKQRWFAAKAMQIQSVELADCIPVRLPQGRALITLARVEYSEGGEETYVLPLAQSNDIASRFAEASDRVVQFADSETSSEITLTEAMADREFLAALFAAVQGNVSQAGQIGALQARRTTSFEKLIGETSVAPVGRLMKAEQSNTSVVYGDHLILKFYRRLQEGVNPDLEVGQFLTEVARFPNIPPLCGSLEYCSRDGKGMTVGIFQGFVPNQGDAWHSTLTALRDFLAEAAEHLNRLDLRSSADSHPVPAAGLPEDLTKMLVAQTEVMGLLGRRTAELHLALSSSPADPAFSPEPFTAAFRESLESSLHDLAVRNFTLLRSKREGLPEALHQLADSVLKLEDDVLLLFHAALDKEISAVRTRIHGDFHLGQVLSTGSDFVIIDFEGEPARTLRERRTKRSPLQDVAGMLRSFQYAARAASMTAKEEAKSCRDVWPAIEAAAQEWQTRASRRFLEEYWKTAGSAPFLPAKREEAELLLKLHLLEKAVYELGYELNNRPAWLAIPLKGIEELAGAGT